MLAVFCLRLAFGLLASLMLLLSPQVNSRFYRAHFLTAVGLTTGALILLFDTEPHFLWWTLAACVVACILGSMSWSIENNPGGRSHIVLATVLSGAALVLLSVRSAGVSPMQLANDFTSAVLLGSATTAMLLGHSYLIAPTMSIQPLMRLLAASGLALLLRLVVAVWGLWSWTETTPANNLETEVMLWLLVRWGVGLLAPLVLGWMAWETARIRSTQSATGILYVVVICCFLGELTSQLLCEKTGLPL